MYKWKKDIVQWTIKDTLYLSVVFTWDLPRVREIAQQSKKRVIVGGPAVRLMPDYLGDVAEVQYSTCLPALSFHNPMATFTTRGCPNKCSFCAVPRTEGDLVELDTWDVRPIICDNNLLAASKTHFDRVIDSLKCLPYVDFNQGLDARLFTDHHASRIAELSVAKVRFAFDHINEESIVMDAISRARRHGLDDLGVYVLVGFEDTPEDAIYRLEVIRGAGILTSPMRFQPLTSFKKNDYVSNTWTEYTLQKVMQYYSRLIPISKILGISFADFRPKTVSLENQAMLF